jgi:hypothetical protein
VAARTVLSEQFRRLLREHGQRQKKKEEGQPSHRSGRYPPLMMCPTGFHLTQVRRGNTFNITIKIEGMRMIFTH